MVRLLSVGVCLIGLGACASGGPPNAPVNDDAAPTEVIDATTEDYATVTDTADIAKVESATGIETVDVPPVEESEVQVAEADPDERICRREVRTGTHRAVRVCRTRAEIDRMEVESKETFRDLYQLQETQRRQSSTERN